MSEEQQNKKRKSYDNKHENIITIGFKKNLENSKLPEKKSKGAAGYDLFSCETKTIKSGGNIEITTGMGIYRKK